MGLAAKIKASAAPLMMLVSSYRFSERRHKIPCKISLGLAERSAVPMGRRTDGGSFQALLTWLLSLGPFLLRLAIP
jgi:hypothetical protein